MPKVLVVDDEQAARDGFVQAHKAGGWFASAYEGPLERLPRHLEDLRRSELPDLLVLDLYTTNDPPGSVGAASVNAAVDTKVMEIDAKIEELRVIVAAGKNPIGLKLLREIRHSRRGAVRRLPVMLFTRQGLALLSDDELKESHLQGATWMVKGRTPALEQVAMTHTLSSAPRIARDIRLGLIFTALGVLLAPLYSGVVHLLATWTG